MPAALLVGGDFTVAGGVAAANVDRWDGASWSPLGAGAEGSVYSLLGVDIGTRTLLHAAGTFGSVLESGDSYLALWSCPDDTPPTLECPGAVRVLDPVGSSPGEVVTYTVTAHDDQDPDPTVVCTPASGSLFPRGATVVTCTATDAAGNVATCRFQVIVERKARRL